MFLHQCEGWPSLLFTYTKNPTYLWNEIWSQMCLLTATFCQSMYMYINKFMLTTIRYGRWFFGFNVAYILDHDCNWMKQMCFWYSVVQLKKTLAQDAWDCLRAEKCRSEGALRCATTYASRFSFQTWSLSAHLHFRNIHKGVVVWNDLLVRVLVLIRVTKM